MAARTGSSEPRGRSRAVALAVVSALLTLALAVALLLWPNRTSAPALVSAYGQTYHNLTYKVSSTGTLTDLHKDATGALIGTMTVKPPLYGTGPIKGTLSGRTFTYSSSSSGQYTALLADDGVLTGTYAYGSGTFTGQKGTWTAEPVGYRRGHSGLPTWLWFVAAGLSGVTAAAAATAWSRRSHRRRRPLPAG